MLAVQSEPKAIGQNYPHSEGASALILREIWLVINKNFGASPTIMIQDIILSSHELFHPVHRLVDTVKMVHLSN